MWLHLEVNLWLRVRLWLRMSLWLSVVLRIRLRLPLRRGRGDADPPVFDPHQRIDGIEFGSHVLEPGLVLPLKLLDKLLELSRLGLDLLLKQIGPILQVPANITHRMPPELTDLNLTTEPSRSSRVPKKGRRPPCGNYAELVTKDAAGRTAAGRHKDHSSRSHRPCLASQHDIPPAP